MLNHDLTNDEIETIKNWLGLRSQFLGSTLSAELQKKLIYLEYAYEEQLGKLELTDKGLKRLEF